MNESVFNLDVSYVFAVHLPKIRDQLIVSVSSSFSLKPPLYKMSGRNSTYELERPQFKKTFALQMIRNVGRQCSFDQAARFSLFLVCLLSYCQKALIWNCCWLRKLSDAQFLDEWFFVENLNDVRGVKTHFLNFSSIEVHRTDMLIKTQYRYIIHLYCKQ